MNGQAMLAITSHGNAPYLMSARVARALKNRPVVIPLYYGETQKRILREEIHENHDQIFLSDELGKLLTPLLLDVKNGGSFADFAENLADPNNPAGILAIENKLKALLQRGIPAEALDGSSSRIFSMVDFAGALISALPIRVDLPHKYYFFTALLSQLYGTSPEEQPDSATATALQRLQKYAQRWQAMEAECAIRFVPRIHAFSYMDHPLQDVEPTPPLSFTRKQSSVCSQPGVLFSPSGTGTDAKRLVGFADHVPNSMQKYVLAGMRDETDFPTKQFVRVPASSYADPSIQWVVSRGGWGTVWECEMNLKPMILVETTFVDDPEIGHTQKALKHLGQAWVVCKDQPGFPTEQEREQIYQRLQLERLTDVRIFGAEASDGFAFMARKILEHERAVS